MHFGHIGVALAARPLIPKVSFGLILLASTSLDILTAFFFIAGLERIGLDGIAIIPWSHGLFMSIIWSLLALFLCFFFLRDFKVSILFGGLVFCHWILDFISHPMGFGKAVQPDIPLLFYNSPLVGLGLYNSVLAALITEFGFLIIGSIIYLRHTKPKKIFGKWVLAVLIFYIIITLIPPILLPKNLILLSTILYLPLLPIGFGIDRYRVIK